MKTRFLEAFKRCRQGPTVAGGDPGETEGAIAIASILRGPPSVERIVTWKKRVRKAGTVWEVVAWFGEVIEDRSVSVVGEHRSVIYRTEVDSLTKAVSTAFRGVPHAPRVLPGPVWGVVEGMGLHGKKSGTVARCEAAGVMRSVFESHVEGPIERPHKMKWFADVCGIPGNSPDEVARKVVLAAMSPGGGQIKRDKRIAWDVYVPEEVMNEHVGDALGLSLRGLGFRLTGVREDG